MNAAYWMALIWTVLAFLALKFVIGNNNVLVGICVICAAVASLLGVAISYNLI